MKKPDFLGRELECKEGFLNPILQLQMNVAEMYGISGM